MKEMVFGPGGLLQSLPPKSVHLCMCTISVETSAELAAAHAKADQGYVAAPIFGRADAVESRHIWILAGGPEPQVKRCLPIFVALGRGHTRVGPKAALAHALKLGGNVLSVAMEQAVGEILAFAKTAGLAPADYLRLLNTAIFRSHMVDAYEEASGRPSFDPADQTLDLAADEMLIPAAKDLGIAIPVADQLNARLQAAGARGWGEKDLAELAEACRAETEATAAEAKEPAVTAPSLPEPEDLKPSPSIATLISMMPASAKDETIHIWAVPEGVEQLPPTAPMGMEPPPDLLDSTLAEHANGAISPGPDEPVCTYKAMYFKVQVVLDLYRTSHFETIKGHVYAWCNGKQYDTSWRSLAEVEAAFKHVLFMPLKRNILLRPEAVLDLVPTFGGKAKAVIGENLELEVSRAAVPRLKELLGI
jgi:3-hydroxyisobutyrate dehydrogenase-like beta-hydroxyacid dehydrogenase